MWLTGFATCASAWRKRDRGCDARADGDAAHPVAGLSQNPHRAEDPTLANLVAPEGEILEESVVLKGYLAVRRQVDRAEGVHRLDLHELADAQVEADEHGAARRQLGERTARVVGASKPCLLDVAVRDGDTGSGEDGLWGSIVSGRGAGKQKHADEGAQSDTVPMRLWVAHALLGFPVVNHRERKAIVSASGRSRGQVLDLPHRPLLHVPRLGLGRLFRGW